MNRDVAVTDQTNPKVFTLQHYGGGVLNLDNSTEALSFALGRMERAADMVEVCSRAIGKEDPATTNSLQLVVSMIFEAREALQL